MKSYLHELDIQNVRMGDHSTKAVRTGGIVIACGMSKFDGDHTVCNAGGKGRDEPQMAWAMAVFSSVAFLFTAGRLAVGCFLHALNDRRSGTFYRQPGEQKG